MRQKCKEDILEDKRCKWRMKYVTLVCIFGMQRLCVSGRQFISPQPVSSGPAMTSCHLTAWGDLHVVVLSASMVTGMVLCLVT